MCSCLQVLIRELRTSWRHLHFMRCGPSMSKQFLPKVMSTLRLAVCMTTVGAALPKYTKCCGFMPMQSRRFPL